MHFCSTDITNILRKSMKLWLPLFITLSIGTYYLYLSSIEHQTTLLQKEQQNLVLEAKQIIRARLHSPQRDVLHLANEFNLQRFIQTNQNQQFQELIGSLESFMASRHDIYTQMRYLDENGLEIIRMENINGVVKNIDQSLLQNKSNRYYFQETRDLEQGEVYISRLDLNVEHGQVEVPNQPVMRFISRVYSENGQAHGIIILNFLGNALLERLKTLIPIDKGMEFWLLDSEGYWLSNPVREYEWGFMFEDKIDLKLSKQDPILWHEISSQTESSILETKWNGGLFTASLLSTINNQPNTNQYLENYNRLGWHIVALMTQETLSTHLRPAVHRYRQAYAILLTVFSALSLWFGLLNHRRHQAEKIASQSHHRIEIAARAGGVGIWEYNLADGSLIWDDKMYSLYGIGPDSFDGAFQAWERGVHPEDLAYASEILQKSIEGGHEFSAEFRVVTPSGEVRWIKANAEVIKDDYGKAILMIGTNIDITEKEQYTRELEKARNAAELMAKSKSEFLANMSHEIRTPMNAIIGLSGLGLRLDDLTPKLKDYLSKIQTSSKALLSILNDILDLSKIESGFLELESEEFDLEESMLNIIDLFSLPAHEKGLELILNTSPDIPARILGDSLRLGQVINNLVGNALKFTQDGEVFINVTLLNNEPNAEQATICFEVKDTGIGMTQETKNQLFEAFQQGDGSITRRFGGTGLGLTISKQLVGKMGGEIIVDSEYGKGSTFSFNLDFPIVSRTRLDRSPDQLRTMRVLVVDDIETSRQVLSDLLVAWKFDVVAVSSGIEALDVLAKDAHRSEKAFELIILDWKMPEMDGVMVAQRINDLVSQKVLKSSPIIMMVTAFNRDDLLNEIRGIQLHAILTKPVSTSRMFDVIMNIQGNERIEQSTKVSNNLYDLASPVRGAQVLVVEDNIINQIVARDLLVSIGLNVTIADNGEKALNSLQEKTFDIILMDLQMPVMDGFEASRCIRAQSKYESLPIIAMTAAVLTDDRDQCLAAGMNSHVCKPIDPLELIENLIKWIKPRNFTGPIEGSSIPVSVDCEIDISLPQIQGIDTRQALIRLLGKVELFRTLLKQAKLEHKDAATLAWQKWRSGETTEALQQLHTLRGVLGNIGAINAMSQAAIIEKAIKSENEAHVEVLFEQFSNVIEDLFHAVDAYLDDVDQQHTTFSGNLTLDISKIRHLIELLREQTADALEYYEKLRKTIEGQLSHKSQQELHSALNSLRFHDAAEILETMIQTL